MSGILKHKKKLITLICVALFTVVYLCLNLDYIFLICIYLLLASAIILNEMTREKMRSMHAPFDTFSSIRNVDYLIIGDQCNPLDFVPKEKTYVQIAAPDRSIRSSYQILRHTHSILKEDGGTVVFPCGNNQKEFLIFDVPFLHTITIKKYHLEGLKMRSNLPFIFEPIASIKFLMGGGIHHTYTAMQDIDEELIQFCRERNYSLQCFIKQ